MTIEEALEQADVDVYSAENNIFIIDKESRSISIPAGIVSLGVESDEKSKRLYFKCPQIVGEGVDLSTFGIKINYQNASSEKDIYICNDVQSAGEYITFSWLLSRKVTKYKGTVQFIVCATKTADDTILNEWNTTLVKMPVLEGLEPENIVVDEPEMDVINQLLQIVKTTSEDVVKQVEETGGSWKTKVEKEGSDWHTKLVQEGTAQQEKVSQEGTMQHTKVVQEGTLQHTKVLQEGTDQHAKLVQEGAAQQTKVSQEGTTQQTKVSKEGTAQYAKLVQEGATQQDKIATKGNDVIASIPSEYAELTEDVEGLKTLYTDKANTITNTVTGQEVIVEDSAEQPLAGLTIYGRTEQDTLKGINLLDMSNAKGGTNNGLTATVNVDGSYKYEGTKAKDSQFVNIWFLGNYNINPGTNPDKILFTLEIGKYYLRGVELTTTKDGMPIAYGSFSGGGEFINIVESSEKRITAVKVYNVSGAAGTKINTIVYPMIVKVTEDVVPPWEKYVGGIPSPNPQYPQELDSIGYIREDERNLFGKTYRNINQKINGINLADVKGSALINPIENRFIIDGKSDATRIQNIKVNIKKGKTYTLYYDYKLLSGTIIPSNYIQNVGAEEQYGIQIKTPFVAKLDSRYIGIFFSAGQTGSKAEITNVQLVEGSKLYPYQPYNPEQTLQIDTPNGLRGIPVTSGGNYTDKNGQQWVCDTIDFKTGVLTERIGAVDNSKWLLNNIAAGGKGHRFKQFITNISKDITNTLCSNYKFIDTSSYGTQGDFISLSEVVNGIINIRTLTKDFETVAEFIEYAESTNMQTFYALGTPIETKLSADQIARFRAVHTNCPVTTMHNDDMADFSVEYAYDLKTYIDNKLAGMQQSIISKVYQLGAGTDIPDGSDFNKYKTIGIFSVDSSVNAATMLNIPVKNSGGRLIVQCLGSKDSVKHTFESNLNDVYTRISNNNGIVWTPWKKVTMVEI